MQDCRHHFVLSSTWPGNLIFLWKNHLSILHNGYCIPSLLSSKLIPFTFPLIFEWMVCFFTKKIEATYWKSLCLRVLTYMHPGIFLLPVTGRSDFLLHMANPLAVDPISSSHSPWDHLPPPVASSSFSLRSPSCYTETCLCLSHSNYSLNAL